MSTHNINSTINKQRRPKINWNSYTSSMISSYQNGKGGKRLATCETWDGGRLLRWRADPEEGGMWGLSDVVLRLESEERSNLALALWGWAWPRLARDGEGVAARDRRQLWAGERRRGGWAGGRRTGDLENGDLKNVSFGFLIFQPCFIFF